MISAKVREDFPVLGRKWNGKPLVYLDNAATSLTPKPVIETISNYYLEQSSNVARGVYKIADEATEKYAEARHAIAEFIGAASEEIIFTRNATEGINIVMRGLLAQGVFKDKPKVVITAAEHHSNLVPWQWLQDTHHVELIIVPLTEKFEINLKELENAVDNKTALVSVAHTFNTIGTVNSVQEIVQMAQDKDSQVLVDAAQGVPHHPIDVKKIGSEFTVFSGHKMLGPTGIGVLHGTASALENLPPFLYGGDMIEQVSYQHSTYDKIPHKFEAGTPAIASALGLGAAVKYLEKVGMAEIKMHEQKLVSHALEQMNSIKGVKTYMPPENKQSGIILFELNDWDCHDLALAMDEAANIAIRSGVMCAEPFIRSLNSNGLCRASVYLYNTKAEIDQFTQILGQLARDPKLVK